MHLLTCSHSHLSRYSRLHLRMYLTFPICLLIHSYNLTAMYSNSLIMIHLLILNQIRSLIMMFSSNLMYLHWLKRLCWLKHLPLLMLSKENH